MRRRNPARVLGPYEERDRWRLIVVEEGDDAPYCSPLTRKPSSSRAAPSARLRRLRRGGLRTCWWSGMTRRCVPDRRGPRPWRTSCLHALAAGLVGDAGRGVGCRLACGGGEPGASLVRGDGAPLCPELRRGECGDSACARDDWRRAGWGPRPRATRAAGRQFAGAAPGTARIGEESRCPKVGRESFRNRCHGVFGPMVSDGKQRS